MAEAEAGAECAIKRVSLSEVFFSSLLSRLQQHVVVEEEEAAAEAKAKEKNAQALEKASYLVSSGGGLFSTEEL